MADSKTALILVMMAACTVSWENLPTIPAGRRAEYYLLHDDGAYKHGYDTGEGQAASAMADVRNQVQGQWQYVNDEGQRVNWAYTAGDVGFVPVLVTDIGGATFKSTGSQGSGHQISGSAAHTSSSAHASSAHGSGSSSRDSAHGSSAQGSASSSSSWGAAQGASAQGHEVHDDNADASYKFNIDTSSYTRDEQADKSGNIQGRYSYNSPVGGSHAVSYTAGKDTGFVVTSSTSDVAAAKQAVPVVPWTGPLADIQSVLNADGSYSYSYNNGDAEHHVSSDAQNNVRGSYSSTSGGRIDYHAGADSGYVASSDAVPVAPAVPAVKAAWSASQDASQGAWSANSAANQGAWSANAAADDQGAWSAGQTGESHDASEDSGDASYSYSYETDSSAKQESSDASGNVAGSFTYLGGDGVSRKLTYTANGDEGFIASGDHLPVAPDVPVAAVAWSAPAVPVAPAPWAAPAGNAWSNTGAATAHSSANNANDGSYSYSYSTDTQSVQQSSDADNNVKGSYSFKAKDDGQTRRVDYTAGAATGFVASGDHLPVAPVAVVSKTAGNQGSGAWSAPAIIVPPAPWAAPAVTAWSNTGAATAHSSTNNANDGSYSYSYSTDTQSVQQSSDADNNVKGSYSFKAKDDGQTRRVDYTAGAATGFVATGDHLPVAPLAVVSKTTGNQGSGAWSAPAVPVAPAPWSNTGAATAHSSANNANDGSYSYSYSTDTQSVQQSSDADNNVKGSYSFKAKDDGQTRRVDYTAGAATGFVATGDHLPVAPVADSGAAWKQQAQANSAWQTASQSGSVGNSAWSAPAAPVHRTSPPHPGGSADAKNDGSYSYSYSTDTQSVQQSSDADNNVKGSYSFKAKDDGQTRRVDYTAGAATGFVATGDHLPVAPVADSGAAWKQQAQANSAWQSASQSGSAGNSAWAAPAVPVHRTSPPHPGGSADAKSDGSYSYSYSTDTQSVQQSSDADNNVKGSYSFKAKDDGQTRTVNWQAGSATGFVAQGAHLPVADERQAAAKGAYGSNQWNQGGISQSAHGSQSQSSASDESGDKSYSYSYKTDSSSKDESSDASGNVMGTFTYLGGDGVSRKLTYTARPEDGFVASGAHLPVAPSVGGVATAYSANSAAHSANSAAHSANSAAHSAHSSSSSAHAQGLTTRDGNVVVSRYLPPASPRKFGYVFDTKA